MSTTFLSRESSVVGLYINLRTARSRWQKPRSKNLTCSILYLSHYVYKSLLKVLSGEAIPTKVAMLHQRHNHGRGGAIQPIGEKGAFVVSVMALIAMHFAVQSRCGMLGVFDWRRWMFVTKPTGHRITHIQAKPRDTAINAHTPYQRKSETRSLSAPHHEHRMSLAEVSRQQFLQCSINMSLLENGGRRMGRTVT